jgi:hypothetical protein
MYLDFLTFAVFAMILVTVALQVVATRRVHRDVSFAPDQRKAQLWMIWLLPILGASIVLSVLHDEPVAHRENQSLPRS